MGIVHVRIDERLIHGQVANMWTNNLRVTRIMVVDNEASQNDVVKMSLKLATPSGIALSVLNVEKASERIKSDSYVGQRVMLIVKSVDMLIQLMKAGVTIESVNLGNISYREGKRRISSYVNLNKNELEELLWIRGQGVDITIQLIPTAPKEHFGEKIESYL